VDGTRHVLDLAVASGAHRFLLTSSGGAYGPAPPGMARIPEDHLGMADPLAPGNAYSVAKRAAEHLCALYRDAHGLDIVIARCFSFVGQDLPLDVHFAIGNFIRDALHRQEITVAGDGAPVRSYMDQRDLARWLLTLLTQGRAGEAYNVGSDIPISIGELAHRVRDVLAPGKPVRIQGTPQQRQWRNTYVPDIDKARSELSLHLQFDLNSSLRGFLRTDRLRPAGG
jgi:dTDP-glucose 4,6-dehydratase